MCDRIVNDWPCNGFHHSLLHKSEVNGTLLHNLGDREKDKALLAVSSVPCLGQSVTTLWDSGSDVTIVTHEMPS